MRVPIRYILAAIAFAIAALGFILLPTRAHADDCRACQPPPPCHCEPPPSCNSACAHSEAHAEAHANAFAVNVARARTPDVVIRNRGGGVDVSVSAGVESSLFLMGATELHVTEAGASSAAAASTDTEDQTPFADAAAPGGVGQDVTW
ncbi:MAG TPA: hypothetical protein VG841_16125 [Caulobacterales bacterium]|nr:hypothetical protein [Caulobacterales bacterium]